MTVPDEFDYAKNTAYVAQGFKKGTYFDSPNLAQPMTFENDNAEITAKLQGAAKPDMSPVQDPWVNRK